MVKRGAPVKFSRAGSFHKARPKSGWRFSGPNCCRCNRSTFKKASSIWEGACQTQSLRQYNTPCRHSLLAARLLSKVSDEFGVRLAVRDLFDNPTVQMFAQVYRTVAQYFTRSLQLLDRDQRASTPGPILDLEAEADNHDLKDAVMDLHLRAFWRSVVSSLVSVTIARC